MTTIGAVGGAIPYIDRAAQIELSAKASNGRFTAQEVAARLEERDVRQLHHAQSYQGFLDGKGTYLGHSVGNKTVWKPDLAAQQISEANAARVKPYLLMSGPVTIEAIDVDSAVKAQGQLTGGDLKNLSAYADYLRNEVAAASSVKSDVTFTGAWGKDRVTHDVNEYIGWLMQAAQQKSQAATDAG